MKKTTIALNNGKSLQVFESSAVEPAIWLELRYDDKEQGFGLCDVEACRELVKALNTFIAENS